MQGLGCRIWGWTCACRGLGAFGLGLGFRLGPRAYGLGTWGKIMMPGWGVGRL